MTSPGIWPAGRAQQEPPGVIAGAGAEGIRAEPAAADLRQDRGTDADHVRRHHATSAATRWPDSSYAAQPATVKIARRPGVRIYEVPISYKGRTYAEGKKIGLKDAFRAMYCLARYGIIKRT